MIQQFADKINTPFEIDCAQAADVPVVVLKLRYENAVLAARNLALLDSLRQASVELEEARFEIRQLHHHLNPQK